MGQIFEQKAVLIDSGALALGERAETKILVPKGSVHRRLYCAGFMITDSTTGLWSTATARFRLSAKSEGQEVLKFEWDHAATTGTTYATSEVKVEPFSLRPSFRCSLRDADTFLHLGQSMPMCENAVEQSFRLAAGYVTPAATEVYMQCAPFAFTGEVDEIELVADGYSSTFPNDLIVLYVGCQSSAVKL